MSIDLRPMLTAKSIGIGVKELCEIGSFSERFARDIFSGKAEMPYDVQLSVNYHHHAMIQIADFFYHSHMEGNMPVIPCFRNNATARNKLPPVEVQTPNAAFVKIEPFACYVNLASLDASDQIEEATGQAPELKYVD